MEIVVLKKGENITTAIICIYIYIKLKKYIIKITLKIRNITSCQIKKNKKRKIEREKNKIN